MSKSRFKRAAILAITAIFAINNFAQTPSVNSNALRAIALANSPASAGVDNIVASLKRRGIEVNSSDIKKRKKEYEGWWGDVKSKTAGEFNAEAVQKKLLPRWGDGKFWTDQDYSSGYGISAVAFVPKASPLYRRIFAIRRALMQTRAYKNKKLVMNPPGCFHLTIFGLKTRLSGKISEGERKGLEEVIIRAISRYEGINIGIGYVNDLGISRTARINIQGFITDGLRDLRDKIEAELKAGNFDIEKPSGEHVTIATIKANLTEEEFNELTGKIDRLQARFKKGKALVFDTDNITFAYHQNDLLENNLFQRKLFLHGIDSRVSAGKINKFVDKGKRPPAKLRKSALAQYRYEQRDILLKGEYFDIKADNSKYGKDSKALFFDGVTTVASLPREEGSAIYELFKDSIEKINSWQNQHLFPQDHILATVPVKSMHVTTYDAVCRDDWLSKYNSQLNESTKNEIECLFRERSKGQDISGEREQTLRKEIIYAVVARRISEALKTFRASKVPEFTPTGIAAFPPHSVNRNKTLLILNVTPKSAEDLAVLTKMQNAIREATGIKNFGPLKGHITLGYFINDSNNKSIGQVKIDQFKNFIRQIDGYIRKKIEENKNSYVFKLPQIELSRFNDMDSFPADETFPWTGPKLFSTDIPDLSGIKSDVETNLIEEGRKASLAISLAA